MDWQFLYDRYFKVSYRLFVKCFLKANAIFGVFNLSQTLQKYDFFFFHLFLSYSFSFSVSVSIFVLYSSSSSSSSSFLSFFFFFFFFFLLLLLLLLLLSCPSFFKNILMYNYSHLRVCMYQPRIFTSTSTSAALHITLQYCRTHFGE